MALLACLLWQASDAATQDVRQTRKELIVKGEVKEGVRFTHPFGGRFALLLEPSYCFGQLPDGWTIAVLQAERDQNLAEMTPPWRGRGELDIFGWHFRPENAPPTGCRPELAGVHRFVFSPEVGVAITWDMLETLSATEASRAFGLIERIRQFGEGDLRVTACRLAPPDDRSGGNPRLVWMRFEAKLSWLDTTGREE
jgi:hypothetical protein